MTKLQLINERSCGECTACCTVLAVATLTDERERCEHERDGGGCEIYDERPAPCESYWCVWLHGFGSEEDRPDRLGLILDLGQGRKNPTLVAREVRSGVGLELTARLQGLAIAVKLPVALDCTDGGRSVFYPDGQVSSGHRDQGGEFS